MIDQNNLQNFGPKINIKRGGGGTLSAISFQPSAFSKKNAALVVVHAFIVRL
jgi:hypothetical protein